jgi:hypothetical protein
MNRFNIWTSSDPPTNKDWSPNWGAGMPEQALSSRQQVRTTLIIDKIFNQLILFR